MRPPCKRLTAVRFRASAFIFKMVTTKTRRHSGRYWPKPTDVGEDNVYIHEEYDDWGNYRDSMRVDTDPTHIRSVYMWFANSFNVKKFNKKLKKMNLIRKLKQRSLRHK